MPSGRTKISPKSGRGLGHVTPTIFVSTVGYPSDSLASCSMCYDKLYRISNFYRAMHFRAERGLAIACRLSVCPSVTLVDCDHTGWNSSEIISPLVSLGCSLSVHPNTRGLLQGKQPEILNKSDPPPVDLSVGDIRSQIAAEWLQIAQRSQWTAYRKPPSLFRTAPSLTPTTSVFPKWGFHMPQDTRMAISPQRVIRYT